MHVGPTTNNTTRTTLTARLLTLPARSPRVSLALIVLVVLLSMLSAMQLRIDARLETMFASDSAASRALGHVLNDFHGNDELLVLVEAVPAVGIGDDNTPDHQRQRAESLWAFGQRLEQAIAQDADAAELVKQVIAGAGEAGRAFAQEVVTPNAAYYMDDERFAQFTQRLTSQGMAEQIRRNEQMVALPGPAAGPMVNQILRDPLHIYELVAPSLERMRPGFATFADEPRFISPEARSLLVRVVGTRSSGDAEFAERLMQAIPRCVALAQPGDLRVSYAGGYAIADHSRQEIRSDLIGCVTGSLAMILLLFVVLYRRPWRWLLVLPPVAVGVLAGFGVFALLVETVTPVTAAIGGILAGLSVDYAIHYLAHYQVARRRGEGVVDATDLGPGLLYALLAAGGTSVLGFGAIATSTVPLLRGFALLGVLGLAGALVATLWVLPTLLALIDSDKKGTGYIDGPNSNGRGDPRLPLGAMVHWLDRRRWIAGATSLIAVAMAMALAWGPWSGSWIESDVAVMHPQPNPPLATQQRIAEQFGMAPDSLVLHMQSESSESLAALIHAADTRLRAEDLSDVVSHVASPAMLLPDASLIRRRQAALAQLDADQIVADLHAALDASIFDADQFVAYGQVLRRMVDPQQPPTLHTLVQHPELVGMMFPIASLEDGTPPMQALAIVSLRQKLSTRVHREAVLARLHDATADLPGATFTGIPIAGHEMDLAIGRDLPRMVLLALGLVALWGAACLRGPHYALLALMPVAFTAICLLFSMRLLGLQLNLINMLGLPILLGVTIDAGVFLTRTWVEHRLGRITRDAWLDQLLGSLHATLLASLTTILGFGSLIFASTPAIASLGLMLVIGMTASVVGCFLLLTPLLLAMPVRPSLP